METQAGTIRSFFLEGPAGRLEALLNAQEALRALHGDLKISTSNSANRKILEITRLDQQLEVFETMIDAVKSFA